MAISQFLNRTGKGIGKTASFLGGAASYFAGIAPQIEEAASEISGKAANHSLGHMFLNSSQRGAKNLIVPNVIKNSIKEVEEGHGFMGYGFTTGAKAFVLGAAGVVAVKNGVSESNRAKMGQVDTINQAPPSMTYDYTDISGGTGADGNLVFSLNKLRNG